VKLLDENKALTAKLNALEKMRASHAESLQTALAQVGTYLAILFDYPAGQDDGSWIKRRDAALQAVCHDPRDFYPNAGPQGPPSPEELARLEKETDGERKFIPLPEVTLNLDDHGTDWEVQCGYIDHLIMDERYDNAFKEMSESGMHTALWVLYFGLYCSLKHSNERELAKYAAFVQHAMRN
jgi:hypothetical protein